MKKQLLFISIICLFSVAAIAQAAYILPSPTGKNDTITLFINIAQTTDGVQNSGMNARLNAHPDDDVYLWSWQPAAPIVGNGAWNGSNTALKMTKVSDKLYSLRFKPTSFYGVDATQFFSLGISCLAKMLDGNAYAGEFPGEAKTEDLHINVIPRLCDELYCSFPELAKTNDFLSITYDNNQETNPALQGLGTDDCYLFVRAQQSTFVGYNYTTPELASATPALKMKPVSGYPGFFRLTVLPEDFFNGIVPADFDFKSLRYYAIKPGFTYTGSPPYQSFTFQVCE